MILCLHLIVCLILVFVLNYNKSRLDIPAQQNFSCFSCPKKSNHMEQTIKPCVLLQCSFTE